MPKKLMYPRNNTNEVAMFFDYETQEYIRCSNFNKMSGQYDAEIRFTNPLEAWTSYLDALDSIVRKQIMSKYTLEELGLTL